MAKKKAKKKVAKKAVKKVAKKKVAKKKKLPPMRLIDSTPRKEIPQQGNQFAYWPPYFPREIPLGSLNLWGLLANFLRKQKNLKPLFVPFDLVRKVPPHPFNGTHQAIGKLAKPTNFVMPLSLSIPKQIPSWNLLLLSWAKMRDLFLLTSIAGANK